MAITLPANLYTQNLFSGVYTYEWFKNLKVLNGYWGPEGSGAPFTVRPTLFQGAGDYVDNPVLKPIASAEDKRNVASGGSSVTPAELTSRNDLGVFVRRRWLVNIGEDAGKISKIGMEKLVSHSAEQAVKEFAAVAQNFAIGIAKAAITNMTTALHTKSVWAAAVRTNLSTSLLVQARALMGDKEDMIGAGKGLWIVRSESLQDLTEGQLASGVSGIADNVVRTGQAGTLGAPYISVNDAALTTADAGFDKYYTLGLGAGMVNVTIEPPKFYAPEQRLDTETVSNLLRVDQDFYFQVPGFEYDDGNGGVNPTLTAASLSTNWDPLYSDAREVHGVLIEHNYSGN